MFTGIIEEVGRVKGLAGERLMLRAEQVLEGTKEGDSINVNGACLTVTGLELGSFSTELMPETRRRTNLGGLRSGAGVNLERALQWGGRLGGHLVQGHVDGLGKVLSIIPEEKARLLRLAAPAAVLRYLVPQGFIALDGISLTVVECDDASFTVSLVGYTWEHSNLKERRPGDAVNLEVDIIAKYVEKLKAGQRFEQVLSTFLKQ